MTPKEDKKKQKQKGSEGKNVSQDCLVLLHAWRGRGTCID
jgi:hypothetical protein